MFIKAIASALAITVASFGVVNTAEASGYRYGYDVKVGGFRVNVVDRYYVDTIVVPLPSHDGVVNVTCSSGIYEYSGLPSWTAKKIANAWCG